MKFLIICISISFFTNLSVAHANEEYSKKNSYCAAIRGNGELIPAHWGSMARLIERYGMPAAMSGGSSASITMFLIESISINQLANKTPQSDEKKALLVKSIEGYFNFLKQSPEGKAFANLMLEKEKLTKLIQSMAVPTSSTPSKESAFEMLKFRIKHLADIQILMGSSDLKHIINPEMQLYILETVTLGKKVTARAPNQAFNPGSKGEIEKILNYRYSQIQQALKNFGKFNTLTDKTLFFRPGIIDFEKIAKLFGRMANFYAGFELTENNPVNEIVNNSMEIFLNRCSRASKGKSWQEIIRATPQCQKTLYNAISNYTDEFKRLEKSGADLYLRVQEEIGKYISTFPTTSIIVGDGADNYNSTLSLYGTNSNPSFGSDFQIHPSQYRFGYWGNSKELDIINHNLKSRDGFLSAKSEYINLFSDKKSQKFTPIKYGLWIDALSTSPAEPGLARILPITGTRGILSAGGWGDLHPTLVLKALGCANVIYITRRGGDSMFAQGVIRKLTNIGGFDWAEWEGLTPDEKRIKNATGDKNDTGPYASSWSKLFNLANPKSSFSQSLKYSDGVWCTNWDQQNIKNGVHTIVADGYNAKFYNQSRDNFLEKGKALSSKEYMTQLLSDDEVKDSPYKYAGCVPLQ